MPFNEYSKQKVCYDIDAYISTGQIIFGALLMIVGAFVALDSLKMLSFLSTLHGGKTLAIEMLGGTRYLKRIGYAIFISGLLMFANGALTIMLRSLHKHRVFIMLSISSLAVAITVVILFNVAYFSKNIKRSINEEVRVKLVRGYRPNDGSNYSAFSEMVDRVQLNVKCCGASGQTDYARLLCKWDKTFKNDGTLSKLQIPVTCCSFNQKVDANATSAQMWTHLEDERCPKSGRLCAHGCIEKAKEWWVDNWLGGGPPVYAFATLSLAKTITSGMLAKYFAPHELEIY